MRPLAASAALAIVAFSAAVPLPAFGFRLTASGFRLPASGLPRLAPRAPHLALGSIRGRVDVRGGRATDVRPDPSGLGMSGPRDPQDRRRSVVYLDQVTVGAFEPREERHARMNQVNERFVPRVLAIAAGTWVDFPNSDRTYHNVFSLTKGNEFNLGRYAAGHSKAQRFDRPGFVRVFCEIHSHMSAYILVFAHRFFAVTDDEGRYRIDGVPPGTYNLTLWNELIRGEPPKRPIVIEERGGDVDADFTVR